MQPAELQERGPSSLLPLFLTPEEKLFIFPWQPPQQTPASKKLNWSSSPDKGRERGRGDPQNWKGRIEDNQKLHSILFKPFFTHPNQLLKRTSCFSEKTRSLPLAWQPVWVSLARYFVQMFERARIMNYRTELPAASTSLATVFFSHSHQCLNVARPKAVESRIKRKTFAVLLDCAVVQY